MRDRNEWFKDVKRLMRGLKVETVENPFAWPTVTSVTDGEDVLHALGLHPSLDVSGIVNVDIDEVRELVRLIEPEQLYRATAWRTVPDLVSGPARRALVHGHADAPHVTAAQIGETERRARALERDRARALKRSRKANR